MKQTLSTRAFAVIEAFDDAAQAWGWERDQGYNTDDIEAARKEYQKAHKALRRYILNLEKQVQG